MLSSHFYAQAVQKKYAAMAARPRVSRGEKIPLLDLW